PPTTRTGSRGLAPPRPGPRVAGVLARPTALADLQRAERVDHDGELVEEFRAQRPLDRAGLRTVGVPAGVQADRALADAGTLARLVVPAAVEHHLVRVHIG